MKKLAVGEYIRCFVFMISKGVIYAKFDMEAPRLTLSSEACGHTRNMR